MQQSRSQLCPDAPPLAVCWPKPLTTTRHLLLQDFACTPSQDLFLQVPAIDRFAWHPFTCAKFERQPGTDK